MGDAIQSFCSNNAAISGSNFCLKFEMLNLSRGKRGGHKALRKSYSYQASARPHTKKVAGTFSENSYYTRCQNCASPRWACKPTCTGLGRLYAIRLSGATLGGHASTLALVPLPV